MEKRIRIKAYAAIEHECTQQWVELDLSSSLLKKIKGPSPLKSGLGLIYFLRTTYIPLVFAIFINSGIHHYYGIGSIMLFPKEYRLCLIWM
ncbi:hypothetical protein [Paenibacillus sp. UMB7766-LJ446]|uniref:hypothetical protein n=1 Tax=Paenibacillus sp. UMB7766-LJ446 TaxID=3046313 RepID=UPI00254CBAC4|nr:hypothetical protein [Paenibacillus sp. UMB7766-LJ446]